MTVSSSKFSHRVYKLFSIWQNLHLTNFLSRTSMTCFVLSVILLQIFSWFFDLFTRIIKAVSLNFELFSQQYNCSSRRMETDWFSQIEVFFAVFRAGCGINRRFCAFIVLTSIVFTKFFRGIFRCVFIYFPTHAIANWMVVLHIVAV